MKRKLCSVAAVLLMSSAPIASADIADEVLAAQIAWEEAFNAGDAATHAMLYTEDAILLPPDAGFVQGREAVQALWQSFMDAGIKNADLVTTGITDLGNTVNEMGTFTLEAPDGSGGTVTVAGKYLVVYERAEDGSLLLDWDTWNMGQ